MKNSALQQQWLWLSLRVGPCFSPYLVVWATAHWVVDACQALTCAVRLRAWVLWLARPMDSGRQTHFSEGWAGLPAQVAAWSSQGTVRSHQGMELACQGGGCSF